MSVGLESHELHTLNTLLDVPESMGYQKGLFYYTSVLTFSEIFFLFGELQHILFAEVFLQNKKGKKKDEHFEL